ncbi:glycosyl hydrolase [Ancylobacter sp. 6x-1]|uniref:Glycosyl hydrolase n=1 Tax=Ancylobacter crimeensis TaxID=2579147 RepID=A0ABT0DAM0_9HYPH|nr:glycosyl hydrolase [Ancylobacter crimeensis]MCK0197013.1 glycosyl hydrolase [Ancylobacter crimeensis]
MADAAALKYLFPGHDATVARRAVRIGLFGLIIHLTAPIGLSPVNAAEVTVDGRDVLVDGRPFPVRGAAGEGRMEMLKALGATTIRTYGGDPGPVLDAADKAGLKVIAGLWLGHPRVGANYDDPVFVARQLADIRATVERYRTHPALLMWGIGNEVEVDLSDDSKVWPAIGEAARLVRSLDSQHPTMAVLAELGGDKVARLKAAAPDVAVLGVNSYGEALPSLPRRVREAGWDGPVVVTEMGVLGQWQAATTPWGAPFEPSSTQKAILLRRYLAPLGTEGVGAILFFWGQKQEVTTSWHSLFLPTGEWTEPLESMAENWKGHTPGDNRAPRIVSLTPAENISAPFASWPAGSTGRVRLEAGDPDGDTLDARWIITSESTARSVGGDTEPLPPEHPEALESGTATEATIADLPPGHYRISVELRDGRGAAATANLPFEIR